ncbi:Rne/Rng family ribonuclease [Amphiplicatus metriothermophilus]|uniref:Ribonuclease E n=1 Tax=Amphiplicatus metriothermophilus TaxID=1519374 RepID=A0A239Q0Z2_9PROT|nr:Rne/Rng family ribonuclease [Amphiplicatus metriothermophilus]MBB5520165.1 ribonuclease E [Amphiplicatus metriothermophilus]SNT75923.1 RNAse E [Amphiplicatus metriothermophilus]
MTKKMLIDAAHPEEVRVCVLENGKVEDFDFEHASRRPLRGNIYLARVTRVEPSLQAAFVEYGGNRHGFLAFNEIHPDYYQIPISDRRILQAAEAEEAALAAELGLDQRGGDGEEGDFDLESEPSQESVPSLEDAADEEAGTDEAVENAETTDADEDHAESADARLAAALEAPQAESLARALTDSEPQAEVDEAEDPAAEEKAQEETGEDGLRESDERRAPDEGETETDGAAEKSAADGEDASQAGEPGAKRKKKSSRAELLERYKEARRKRIRLLRNYKIQEVIKRRQILLVQVVKEERGGKGAALTTYLSLAGRYCVLMPNTARGGGISRKIPLASDRKRLRRVIDTLDLPEGMGLIIRTAGAKRTKAEIKRDYDYLIRLWENIRTLTLKSIAPCLIYEEASLIKRAIRDLYDKDIDQVLVEGDAGYREAKDFMKMLMPSHAKNVQPYREKTPLFLKYDVESQLDAIYQPTVRLKSGGYLVIHQTEALVAIDVNSGKATRERNIEQTALKTNLEAAKEAARQCRLRDLAGLIVIDFIDMEENKNNRAVEKRLKEALKADRARIQIGRISNFGLLEMSRQRRRSGIVDGTTHACPTCNGAGVVRSHETAALRILRAIESAAIAERAAIMSVRASLEVALYILNHKRDWLKRIEDDYALKIEIVADSSKAGDQYELERRGAARDLPEPVALAPADHAQPPADAEDESEAGEAREVAGDQEAALGGGRRRRRRRRRKRDDGASAPETAAPAEEDRRAEEAGDENGEPREADEAAVAGESEEDAQRRRRRRGRRGGRRNRRRQEDEAAQSGAADSASVAEVAAPAGDEPARDSDAAAEASASPAPADEPTAEIENGASAKAQPEPTTPVAEEHADEAGETAPAGESPPAAHDNGVDEKATEKPAAETGPAPSPAVQSNEPAAPRRKSTRKGWWQRALGG